MTGNLNADSDDVLISLSQAADSDVTVTTCPDQLQVDSEFPVLRHQEAQTDKRKMPLPFLSAQF